MTMPARQLVANSVRIMITFRSGYAPSRTLYLDYGGERNRVQHGGPDLSNILVEQLIDGVETIARGVA
jgi:hypothetical protein